MITHLRTSLSLRILVLVAVATLGIRVTAALAAEPITAGYSPDGKDLPWLLDPRVDPSLSAVGVDTLEFKVALARYRTTEKNLFEATSTHTRAVAELADLLTAEARLVGDLNEATRRKLKSEKRLVEIRENLRVFAVDDYVRGSSEATNDIPFDLQRMTDTRGKRVLVTTVRQRELSEGRRNAGVVSDMAAHLTQVGAELDDVTARIVTTTATRDRSAEQERMGSERVVADAKALADARLTGTVTGLDFSFVALDAYVKAAKRMAAEQPTCAIRWALLAGVSRTEGHHGTYAGASLDADGNETKPIIGIALDGGPGIAVVNDTDGGRFDGDPNLDRAVGPMQFIPSTWKRWGRDGDGNGEADPQNIYDATLAAAAYLCYSGPGLDADEGMRRALFSYNASVEYGDIVIARALEYEAFVLPPAPPLKPTPDLIPLPVPVTAVPPTTAPIPTVPPATTSTTTTTTTTTTTPASDESNDQ